MIARILRTSEFEISALTQRMFAAVSPARSRSFRRSRRPRRRPCAGRPVGARRAHTLPGRLPQLAGGKRRCRSRTTRRYGRRGRLIIGFGVYTASCGSRREGCGRGVRRQGAQRKAGGEAGRDPAEAARASGETAANILCVSAEISNSDVLRMRAIISPASPSSSLYDLLDRPAYGNLAPSAL